MHADLFEHRIHQNITQVHNFKWMSWRLGFESVFWIIFGRWFQNCCQILPMWSGIWATVYTRLLTAFFYLEYGLYFAFGLYAQRTKNCVGYPLKSVWFKNLSRNVLSAMALTEQKMTFSGQMFATTPMTQMKKMKVTPTTIYRTYRRTSFFRRRRFLMFWTIKLTFITFACKNQYFMVDWSCRVFTDRKSVV